MKNSYGLDDNLKEIIRTSIRSTGFWASIAAMFGVLMIVAGGVLFLGISELRNFAISVLVLGIVLLMLTLVLAPRTIAIYLSGRQGKYGANVIVMVVAFTVILILVNFLVMRNPYRLDLTYTRSFTLAPRTIQVLEERLDNPVEAIAFFTVSDPDKQQVQDLLGLYARETDNFSFRFEDPELNRSLAENYNVTEYPTIVFEDMELNAREHVTSFSEQEFTTALLVVTGESQKRIYLLTGHGERSVGTNVKPGELDRNGFDLAVIGLQDDNYDVRHLSLRQSGEVPEDAAVLVIAGPTEDLLEGELDIISDYVFGGGRIAALFDPGTPKSFVDFISQWGVTLGGDTIADIVSSIRDEELTPLIQRANGQYEQRLLGQPTNSQATGIEITDRLDVTFFPAATSIDPVVPYDEMPLQINIFDLASTTPASWLETDVEDIKISAGERFGPFSVVSAVEAMGPLDTVDTQYKSHSVAKFVIFGDSDFAKNLFIANDDNKDLFLNSINWLAEDFELISVRSELFPVRRLVVNKRESKFIQWSGWVFPPAAMFLTGAIIWWRRR